MARKWWTLAAVSVGLFKLLLDLTIVNVALAQIQRSFGASLQDLQWVIDAYTLTLAALLLTAGSLADLWGRRRLFAAGTMIFTVGSLCGSTTSPLELALSRAGQGIGGAIMFATSLALLSEAFRGKDRGVAFGVVGAITGIAVTVGPVRGGLVTSGLSWRWIFLINVPVGIAAIGVTLAKVAESRDPQATQPDWLGVGDLQQCARGAGLRPDFRRRRVGGGQSHGQPEGRRRAAGRLSYRRKSPAAADAGSVTVSRPYVHRRAARRLQDLSLAVLPADLHRAVPANSARILPVRRGYAPAALHPGHLR